MDNKKLMQYNSAMTFLLSCFYFFYFAIVGVYVIFLPKVLAMALYTPSEIGLILGAAPLVRFLLPFAFTKHFRLDKKSFNISIIVMFLSAFAFYFSIHNFYALFFSNIGLGIGMSLILPYIEILALEYIGKERYGKVRLFGSVGFILVALVLVKYLNSVDIALIYLVALTGVTAIFAFILVHQSHKLNPQKEEVQNDVTLLIHWRLWLGLMLMQMSFGAFYNFFTIYETAHGISLDMTINLWVFGVIVEIIMLYIQGRFLKLNLLLLLEISVFSAVVRWFLLFIYPENIAVLFFTQSLHALSFALFYSASISYLHQLYKSKVLAQQFYAGFTFGLGGFLGAILFGYVYEYFAVYTFLVASFIALLSLIFMVLWRKSLE
jgi:MFS transporter, PPP family, 3-phenylpropionic acid transporter